jgi:hypothetical protein
MKKYLIKGVLALFGGALMFSCAENETEYVPLAQQKLSAFEDVFKEIYGEPDPYQDWGFSSGKVEVDPNDSSQVVEVIDLDGDIAVTRAVAFGGNGPLLAFNAGTRTANTNHNEWGDPTKGFNVNVPPALTEGQKIRVMAYFQANPYLTYVDPHYTTFFVQQVYKGGTSPGAISSESYRQTNGTTLVGSNNMDWLYVGKSNDHVNDYNNGDYNNGGTVQVLNNGANTNDAATQSHPDQITLMQNSSTEYVAFGSSTSSNKHTDCCALAGWAVIEQWAIDHKDSLQAIGKFGATLNDGWNRSFVGLDYEAKRVEELYSGKGTIKAKDLCVSDYILYNGNLYAANNFTDFELTDKNGKKIQYIKDNVSNEAIATYIKKNGNNVTKDTYNYNEPKSFFTAHGITIQNNEARVFHLDDMIKECVNKGAYPTDNNGNWVTNIGGRDYVFSDWIVTLTPAGTAPQPSYQYPEERIDEWTQLERGRVFCEDLGRATREDLDYNDVVFDAIIFQNHTKYTKWEQKFVNGVKVSERIIEGPTEATKYYANVEILAAGGTIPITVADYQVHDQFSPKAGITTMVNTRDNNSTAFGSFDTRNPAQIGTISKNFTTTDGTTYNLKLFEIAKPADNQFIKTIKIVSSFDNAQVRELAGEKGGAPQKFMVPVGTKWTSERKNISLAYPGFDAWVTGGAAPWGDPNTTYTYDQSHNSNSVQLPLVMKARRTVSTEGEQALWTGSQQYGSSWSLADMSATLDLDKFYPGDRLRFYGENIGDEAWITVVIGDIKPYFIDSDFPNYYVDATEKKVTRTTGCIEVLLDENSAALLNSKVSDGKVTFQVQGRNFTLTRICRVLFQ